jgi:hypothetical protein
MSDLIERLEDCAGRMAGKFSGPHIMGFLLREAVARIKELEAECGMVRECNAALGKRITELEAIRDQWINLLHIALELKLKYREERDAIEAATIERCAQALKQVHVDTFGRLYMSNGLDALRALAKPPATASAQ